MTLDFNKLIIDNLEEPQIEIVIEFPLSVLGEYNGLSNLDETWDDNIMYIINTSLLENEIKINKSELNILPTTKSYDEKLSYQLALIVIPPLVDLRCIVEALAKENFQKGLCIKRKIKDAIFEALYFDTYYEEENLK